MRPRRAQNAEESAIDLTPMIDVVFILLIFFIVTANFIKESGAEVSKPDAVTAERQEKASILIAIDEAGQIWMDKSQVSVQQVGPTIQRLKAENPEGTIVIQADKSSKNGVLVKVLDQARALGISNVAISARPAGG